MEFDETQYVPPQIQNLLQYPVGEDVNIEEGLCKPRDENSFLLSSIAFLQKQLIKKLDSKSQLNRDGDVNKRYSDLLLVESGQKFRRQKCFIRLPNLEKFDKVLRSEASIPEKILSNTQILPLPKKSKSTKLSLVNFFKQRDEDEDTVPRKSSSVFNIFRKSSTSTKASDSNVSSFNASIVHIDPEKYIIFDEEESADRSVYSTESLSSLKENIEQATLNDCVNSHIDDNTSRYQLNCHKVKELSDIEEEILKVIPTETSLEIKKSINENLRASRATSRSSINSMSSSDVKFIKQEDDYLEDPETGIKFKWVPQTSGRKIKEQQSKLSVCMEDEPESDIDAILQQRNHPFNGGNSVRTMVSSETVEVIMNELLYQLEERGQQ